MKTNRNAFVIIATIIAVVFTALFLVVDVTALFVTAYIFAILGVVGLLFTSLFLLKTPRSYPWAAAIPAQTLTWLIIEVVVSAVFVLSEQLGAFSIDVQWFVLIQIVILAFFAVRVVMLNAGRVEIDRVGDKVSENTLDWKTLIVDVETLAARSPEVKPVLDAIRYSDPVTSPKLAEYDATIRDSVVALTQAIDNGGGDVGTLVTQLVRQVKDRDSRANLLKGG
jgi:hypothetical protein